jgi:hypothetical protein
MLRSATLDQNAVLLRQHLVRTGNADLIWQKGQDTVSIQAKLAQ